jgi:hypothetical protein
MMEGDREPEGCAVRHLTPPRFRAARRARSSFDGVRMLVQDFTKAIPEGTSPANFTDGWRCQQALDAV